MKTVILAGGLGTRLSEETISKPKPMVEIGGKPILWHLMKIYSAYGLNDFIICCGYKGYLIKEYFVNHLPFDSDINFVAKKNNLSIIKNRAENWNITLIDTGLETNTGGRLRRVKKFLKNEKDFCFTYGDGLSDVNIKSLIRFHKKHKKLATLTATRPPARYGALKLGSKNLVSSFKEKPEGDGSWINGGFFVLKSKVLNSIKDDKTSWEKKVLVDLSKKKQLYAFKHHGFWQPMDTLREKNFLNEKWKSNSAKWKIW